MHNFPIQTVEDKIEILSKEKDFYQVWINFCDQKFKLMAPKLVGIESGQLNETEGPDFQGAEFKLEGKIYRGDVEIHKDCSDWQRHGHHLDTRYDRVVLHLVASKNVFAVFNSKNQKIPSVSLFKFPLIISTHKCHANYDFCNISMDSFVLRKLALLRMANKSSEIYNLISTHGIDQTLYLQILKSLGNVKNKNNYERLASLIPWKLVHILKEKKKPLQFWKALFLGTAGLLNNESDLKIHWQNCLPLIEGRPLKKEFWRWGGIRPNNFPQVRLTGLAQFVYQLKENSIYNNLQAIFYARFSKILFLNKIINTLQPNKNKNYFGKNLILELTGNVFIPLFYKIAIINQSFGFKEYLKCLYLELPSTQHYGRLKPFNNHQKKEESIQKYFYYNQALIYLQNNYCESSVYTFCPLQTIEQKN